MKAACAGAKLSLKLKDSDWPGRSGGEPLMKDGVLLSYLQVKSKPKGIVSQPSGVRLALTASP